MNTHRRPSEQYIKEDAVINYITDNPEKTRGEVAAHFGWCDHTTKTVLSHLTAEGRLYLMRSGNASSYSVSDDT